MFFWLVGDFFDVELCLMEDFSRIVASIFCLNGVKFGSPNNEIQKQCWDYDLVIVGTFAVYKESRAMMVAYCNSHPGGSTQDLLKMDRV